MRARMRTMTKFYEIACFWYFSHHVHVHQNRGEGLAAVARPHRLLAVVGRFDRYIQILQHAAQYQPVHPPVIHNKDRWAPLSATFLPRTLASANMCRQRGAVGGEGEGRRVMEIALYGG